MIDKIKNELSIKPVDTLHLTFTKEEQKGIQQDLINGELSYKEIAEKWKIKSIKLISFINNGRIWKNEELEYPLSSRNNPRLHNFRFWVRPVQKDLMESTLTIKQIAEKHKKSTDTIRKINYGYSYHNDEYKYPLISHPSAD